MKLVELLADPPVLTGAGDDVWDFLCRDSTGLRAGHPLVLSVARLRDRGRAPRRGSVAPGVDLVDLARGEERPGVILCLPERGTEARPVRATWVAWGLTRPSVNLLLGPLLGRLTSTILAASHEVKLELSIHKAFSDITIKRNMKVEQVLTPLSYRIYPETPMAEIQNLMLRREVSAVPVVGASHELLGVVTAGDLLPHLLPGRESGESAERGVPVARQIMTRSVLCVSEDESLEVASRSMSARGVARLPVVRDGELIGFLERGSVMRAFAESIGTSPT